MENKLFRKGQIKTLRFNRIYPEGDEMNFDGEGEGNTYRAIYDWQLMVGIDLFFILGMIIKLKILLLDNGFKI